MRKTTRIERLAKREERVIVRRVISFSILTIILGIFLFTLGIPILGKFADFLEVIFKKDGEQAASVAKTPQPPTLDELPQATNSAKLAVSGFTSDGETVEIHLNGEKVGQVKVGERKFIYEDLVLKDGENKISAKAVVDDKQSDLATTKTVVLDKEAPKLEIETPSEGQSFSGNNRIKVLGKTDRDAQVFANGFLASVDIEGKFEVLVPVAEGESTIEVKAQDLAGNTKVETRKVNFKK